ncbi:MAG: hypothetical protein ACLTS6_13135 [Anaerobutyricum sp.]
MEAFIYREKAMESIDAEYKVIAMRKKTRNKKTNRKNVKVTIKNKRGGSSRNHNNDKVESASSALS